jgi:hypothetical protein
MAEGRSFLGTASAGGFLSAATLSPGRGGDDPELVGLHLRLMAARDEAMMVRGGFKASVYRRSALYQKAFTQAGFPANYVAVSARGKGDQFACQ